MADHLEIEQKYEAGADFVLPALADLPGVAEETDPEVYHLDALYYDTEDLALQRAKVTLRRRTGGSDAGWHLKLPVSTDTRRELHEPLGSTEVPHRLAARVEELTAGSPLVPVASLKTERTVRRLISQAGVMLAEIADDQVTAQRLGAARGEPLIWREIEVEAGDALLAGEEAGDSTGLLAAVGQRLRDAGAAPSKSASKVGRILSS
ncbi:MAG TPA: CYTH domain-containing protein [Streptosporangiaceae bacterium]|nr:CYTH domain-containing protein [Streptosporangiaceae bacterium]